MCVFWIISLQCNLLYNKCNLIYKCIRRISVVSLMTGLRIEIKCPVFCFVYVYVHVYVISSSRYVDLFSPAPLKLLMVREYQQGAFCDLYEHRECVWDETNSFKSSLKFQKPYETEENALQGRVVLLSYQSAVTYPLTHQPSRWNPGLTAPLARCVN